EQNALMRRPYDSATRWRGKVDLPMQTIRKVLHNALTGHIQLMMHIVGDSTLSVVLSLMKQMGSPEAWSAKRVRLEHNATATATTQELMQMAAMGMLMMHTPVYSQRSPLRTLLNSHMKVGISPDGL